MLSIKNEFLSLSKLPLSTKTIEEVKNLRNRCLSEQNYEYFYLCNLLLIDFYIQLSLYDEALSLAFQDLNNIDSTLYRYIYVSYLDNLVYLYIQKRNFRLAYRYVIQKKDYIDTTNREEVNRWNLEIAYIYGELNQKAKALDKLKAITVNLPNDELLSHALSNMTKIYIDGGMIAEAEKTLSKCLSVTYDIEGRLYCDYLYALISIQRKKYKDALSLFREIFADEINESRLNMACDYLALLNQEGLKDEAKVLVKKMSSLVENSPNYELKKTFFHLAIETNLLDNPNIVVNDLLSKLKTLEKEEKENYDIFLNESLEDEKLTVLNEELFNINKRIERLLNLISLTNTNNNLRDLFIDFGQKLSSLIDIDEIHFALYDNILNVQNQEDIASFYYKNKRLYEKNISFNDLKDTIIEAMLKNNQEIFVDFKNYPRPFKNPAFSTYAEDNINYLYALPFLNHGLMFFSIIYGTKYNDLGSLENRLILRMASTLLEAQIRLYMINQNNNFLDFKLNKLQEKTRSYFIIHDEDKVILDQDLVSLFAFSSNIIQINEYVTKMENKEQSSYTDFDFKKLGLINYSLKEGKTKRYFSENVYPYVETNISIGQLTERDYNLNQEEELNKMFNYLKSKTKDLEFKFSFLRLRAQQNEYQDIVNTFSTIPIYLGRDEFIIVLENETNQKSLERIAKKYLSRIAIIRFPRDMINIDEMYTFSKLALDEGITFFTNEFYQKYLNRMNINKLVGNALNQQLELLFHQIKNPDNTNSYEVRANIRGLSNNDIRSDLKDDLLSLYDSTIFNQLIDLRDDLNYYLPIKFSVLKSDLVLKRRSLINHFHFLVYDYSTELFDVIEKLQIRKANLILHHKVLDKIPHLMWHKLTIEGIIIDDSLSPERRIKLLNVAKEASWIIYTNYDLADYEKTYVVSNLAINDLNKL